MAYIAARPRIVTTHPTRRVLRRFFGNITVMPDGCWRWDGHYNNSGYGGATWNYSKTSAHRLMFWMFVRKPEPGEVVDHLCRNIKCVNPAHLEAVTHTENVRRGIAARFGERMPEVARSSGARSMCKRGHSILTANNLFPQLVKGRVYMTCWECRRVREGRRREKRKDTVIHVRRSA